jgi:hypothetical protein
LLSDKWKIEVTSSKKNGLLYGSPAEASSISDARRLRGQKLFSVPSASSRWQIFRCLSWDKKGKRGSRRGKGNQGYGVPSWCCGALENLARREELTGELWLSGGSLPAEGVPSRRSGRWGTRLGRVYRRNLMGAVLTRSQNTRVYNPQASAVIAGGGDASF